MNILVLTTNPWDDRNSIGNTMSNFFSDWTEHNFFNIYFRDSAPNNEVCRNYYRISDKMLLKNFFSPQKIGYEFEKIGKSSEVSAAEKSEQQLMKAVKNSNLKIVYKIEESLWKHKGWQNKRLKNYLEKINPDIIFMFAIPTVSYSLALEYIKNNTKAKTVLFIADNVYSAVFSGEKSPNCAMARRFKKMMDTADLIYGASEEMCEVYGKEFGKSIIPLYKGCEFSSPVKQVTDNPIKITYAGNLLFGRFDTLLYFANEIEKINAGESKLMLEIYSGTPITAEEEKQLNIAGSSKFCGKRQYEEIKEILSSSDIVLHVESFEKEEIEKVKYSFSTKICDCLQSGSVLMVIGPRGISSVEYPKKIPGAIVADSLDCVFEKLEEILSEKDMLCKSAESIRSFAEANHSVDAVHKKLKSDFETVFAGGR